MKEDISLCIEKYFIYKQNSSHLNFLFIILVEQELNFRISSSEILFTEFLSFILGVPFLIIIIIVRKSLCPWKVRNRWRFYVVVTICFEWESLNCWVLAINSNLPSAQKIFESPHWKWFRDKNTGKRSFKFPRFCLESFCKDIK